MSVHDLQLHSESYINFFLSVAGSLRGWLVAAVFGTLCVVGVVLAVLKWRGCIILKCNTGKFE